MSTDTTARGEVRRSAPLGKQYSVLLSHRPPLSWLMAFVLCAGIMSSSHAREADKQQKLEYEGVPYAIPTPL